MDPDDLYTLRAQFWLGHYSLALDEGKSLARRPMPPHLKEEREEFVLRANLALGHYDKVARDSSAVDKPIAIRAQGLRAQYEAAVHGQDADARDTVVAQFQSLLNDPDASNANSSSLQLAACQVFLAHGDMTREALQCVYLGTTMEHLAATIQIYIKMDRLDLAEEQLSLMKQADEDAILTQLCGAFLNIAHGSTKADDAAHLLSSMSEQYGPSPLLLNITAVAHMTGGKFDLAEASLREALAEDSGSVDALVNLCVCYQHLGKFNEQLEVVAQLKANGSAAGHFYLQGLQRTEGAMDREAIKYAPKTPV